VFSPRTLRNVVSVNNKEVFTINFEVKVLGPQFSTKISFDTGFADDAERIVGVFRITEFNHDGADLP
jgi:hypothetical protein